MYFRASKEPLEREKQRGLNGRYPLVRSLAMIPTFFQLPSAKLYQGHQPVVMQGNHTHFPCPALDVDLDIREDANAVDEVPYDVVVASLGYHG